MINILAKRASELFHVQISEDTYSISLFELGLNVEQVLYFLLDISKNQNFDLEEYCNAMQICSLVEIQNSIKK